MNSYTIVKYEATYTSYKIEANNEEDARLLVVDGNATSKECYIDEWHIESITLEEPEA